MNELQIGKLTPMAANVNTKVKSQSDNGFKDILVGALKSVESQETAADNSIADLLQGKAEIHETMIALQKSDISMRLFLKVRSKMMDAYREIMHMQF
jgi:flagellar hook-basal body complex protein FliE